MSRMTPFSSPLLLGFDSVERTLERIGKGGEGYPPYNIERIGDAEGGAAGSHFLRITLAVAGFRPEDLEVTTEENQLTIRGRQADDKDRDYLPRHSRPAVPEEFPVRRRHEDPRRHVEERPALDRPRQARTGTRGQADRDRGRGLKRQFWRIASGINAFA